MRISTSTFRYRRNISLAQSANITWAKPKYHLFPSERGITAMLSTGPLTTLPAARKLSNEIIYAKILKYLPKYNCKITPFVIQ